MSDLSSPACINPLGTCDPHVLLVLLVVAVCIGVLVGVVISLTLDNVGPQRRR